MNNSRLLRDAARQLDWLRKRNAALEAHKDTFDKMMSLFNNAPQRYNQCCTDASQDTVGMLQRAADEIDEREKEQQAMEERLKRDSGGAEHLAKW